MLDGVFHQSLNKWTQHRRSGSTCNWEFRPRDDGDGFVRIFPHTRGVIFTPRNIILVLDTRKKTNLPRPSLFKTPDPQSPGQFFPAPFPVHVHPHNVSRFSCNCGVFRVRHFSSQTHRVYTPQKIQKNWNSAKISWESGEETFPWCVQKFSWSLNKIVTSLKCFFFISVLILFLKKIHRTTLK